MNLFLFYKLNKRKCMKKINDLLEKNSNFKKLGKNLLSFLKDDINSNQLQTKNAFSDKWEKIDYHDNNFKKLENHSKKWYLELYGFDNERTFKSFLINQKIILDAGCGTGHKAAWMAELSPESLIIASDISDSIFSAAKHYKNHENIVWIRGDIMKMPYFKPNIFDYVSCDQVIMHTSNPFLTFKELVRVTKKEGQLSVYVYRKKALPRELLDDYFRSKAQELSDRELTELSNQITSLGKLLSKEKTELNFPSIPLLNIDGGKMSIQRFIYWNFIKCFWDEKLGSKNSFLINYDWYAPSQATRYSKEEFKSWILHQKLEEIFFHQENACYSGRFKK